MSSPTHNQTTAGETSSEGRDVFAFLVGLFGGITLGLVAGSMSGFGTWALFFLSSLLLPLIAMWIGDRQRYLHGVVAVTALHGFTYLGVRLFHEPVPGIERHLTWSDLSDMFLFWLFAAGVSCVLAWGSYRDRKLKTEP